MESLSSREPPPELSEELLALWYDCTGDWQKAHSVAQDINNRTGALIHAYLHRKEGGPGNAAYWYAKARRKPFEGSLEAEREELLIQLLCG